MTHDANAKPATGDGHTHSSADAHGGHGHTHDHGHQHGHSHEGRGGKIGAALREVFAPHSHDASDSIDGPWNPAPPGSGR